MFLSNSVQLLNRGGRDGVWARCVGVLFWVFVAAGSVAAADGISITQIKTGKTIQVELIKLEEGNVTFKTGAGKQYAVPLKSLTEKSQKGILEFIKQSSGKSAEAYQSFNKTVGHILFHDGGALWNGPVSKIAERLGWPMESKAEGSSSFRYYAPLSYTFLGAHPYSATLYGRDTGEASHFSLVFANKGDYGSRLGMGADHFKKIHPEKEMPRSLEDAIEFDAKILAESLSRHLGEPKKQYYGEKENRKKIERWDLEGHAFLLSKVKGEYVRLLIVSTSQADSEGKVKFIKDSEMKKIILENLVVSENGDRVIKNIPMVNQGPKGYCAPATLERAMRYMFVPADMYLLATIATNPEGGTNTTLMLDTAKRMIRSKARRIKDVKFDEGFKMRDIKKNIDAAVPILWTMRSLAEYNNVANRNTKRRPTSGSLSDWKESVRKEAESVSPAFRDNNSNHHLCMIIGYNQDTNELAVSDSWGPRFELRWVHFDIVNAVSSSGSFVISP